MVVVVLVECRSVVGHQVVRVVAVHQLVVLRLGGKNVVG